MSSFPPTLNSLLKPKSAILMFMSASRSRFSAWEEVQVSISARCVQCQLGFFRRELLPLSHDELCASDGSTALQTRSGEKTHIVLREGGQRESRKREIGE